MSKYVYPTTDEVKYCEFPGCNEMVWTSYGDFTQADISTYRVWLCSSHATKDIAKSIFQKKTNQSMDEVWRDHLSMCKND